MGPVVVCGASYFSPASDDNKEFAGKHFSQLVAKALGVDCIALSHPGVSNFSISLQIDHALKLDPRPCLILTGNTRWDRIDFPADIPCDDNRIIDLNLQMFSMDGHLTHNLTTNPYFISTSLMDFFNINTIRLWQKKIPNINAKISAIQKYFENVYEQNIKKQMDTSIVFHYYHKLHYSGIPYILCYEDIEFSGQYLPFPWLHNEKYEPNPNVISHLIKPLLNNSHRGDCPFHTTIEAQEKAAEIILQVYYENFDRR